MERFALILTNALGAALAMTPAIFVIVAVRDIAGA